MLKHTLTIIGLGFVWLLVFSIPIDRDRKIFDIGYSTFIDTKPIHWAINQIKNYLEDTSQPISKTIENSLPESLTRFSKLETNNESQQ